MTLLEFIHDIPAIRDEAKALWGEEIEFDYLPFLNDRQPLIESYKFHLIQMLISNDPLAYYEQHKPKGKL